jgi:hypothetical protein
MFGLARLLLREEFVEQVGLDGAVKTLHVKEASRSYGAGGNLPPGGCRPFISILKSAAIKAQ